MKVSPEMITSVIEKVHEYLTYPAVVGFEKPFIDVVEADFRQFDIEVKRFDRLIALEPSGESKYIVSAHMDRHGFVANGKNEFEYAAYRFRKKHYHESIDIDAVKWELILQRFNQERVYAYDASTGKTLRTATIERSFLCPLRNNFILHIPEFNDLEANTPIALYPQKQFIEGGIMGQLDNVISVAIIFTLFQYGFPVKALLTCEEEIGRSWQYMRDYLELSESREPLLILDTSPFVDKEFGVFDGVVLRQRDGYSQFDTLMTQELIDLASSLDIPYIIKDDWLMKQGHAKDDIGKTELGKLMEETQQKYTGTTLQVPTLGYHSNREQTSTLSLEYMLKILITIITS